MVSLIKKIFCLFLIVTVQFFGNDKLRFDHLTSEDGLSQSTIFEIIQDKKGYMWFATYNGLNKYDGYNFSVYTSNQNDPFSLSSNAVTALIEDEDGVLFLGTFEGVLNSFERETGKFYKHSLDIITPQQEKSKINSYDIPASYSLYQNEAITSFVIDKNNTIWIGTWGQGLIKFNKKTFESEQFLHSDINPMSISSNRISDLAIDSSGTLWVATYGGGLNKVMERNLLLDEPKATTTVKSYMFIDYKHDPNISSSLSDDKILSLYVNHNNKLWIGTFDGGINIFNNSDNSRFQWDSNFEKIELADGDEKSPAIMSILQDNSGDYWIGTFESGLYNIKATDNSITNYQNNPLDKESIAANEVISLFEDNSGSLWLGSHLGDGVSKFAKKEFRFGLLGTKASNNGSLNDGVVWAIYEDSKGNMWYGTYRAGIEIYNKNNKKIKSLIPEKDNPYSLNDRHIKSIIEDYRGNFWIGTYSGGLNFFNSKTGRFQHFVHDESDENSLSRNHVEDIYIDEKKNVWIGIFGGGLNKFNLDEFYSSNKIEFEIYKQDGDSTSLSNNSIYSISEDRKGNLWIGTLGGGLNKFEKDNQHFKVYRHSSTDNNTIGDDKVIFSYEDKEGKIWIGTYGGGLNKLDPKTDKIERFGSEQGLKSDVVYGILEDKNSNLWMSSDAGIFKFDKKENQFIQFDINDGLQSLEFSGGSYYKSKSGKMFFGGVNGINYFFPDSIKENEFIPPIVINKIMVFDQPLPGEYDRLNLSYEQNVISFEFASLDYTNPRENQYAYMLEGFEEVWNFTSAENRTAKYIGITPGEYIFKVKGTNNTGIWNNEGITFSLVISPPFWKTWWFILSLILFFGGSITFFITFRVQHLLAIEKLKSKLAADLHDNIGAGLTEISILSELTVQQIGEINNNASNNLNNISITSRNLVQSMSDIVWVVNPKRDSLRDLVIRLKDAYSELLNQMGISFKTSNFENLEPIKLPMEYRQNLYLIFKEAINNCVKHSNCKKILLEAEFTKNRVKVKLSDDGIGFNNSTKKFGNGLRNMENRAKSIKGELTYTSELNKGTEIIFNGKIDSDSGITYFFKKLKIFYN